MVFRVVRCFLDHWLVLIELHCNVSLAKVRRNHGTVFGVDKTVGVEIGGNNVAALSNACPGAEDRCHHRVVLGVDEAVAVDISGVECDVCGDFVGSGVERGDGIFGITRSREHDGVLSLGQVILKCTSVVGGDIRRGRHYCLTAISGGKGDGYGSFIHCNNGN